MVLLAGISAQKRSFFGMKKHQKDIFVEGKGTFLHTPSVELRSNPFFSKDLRC